MLKEISIEILRKCPNNCLHCSSMSSPNCTEIIPFEKFSEVITDAKRLGLQTVCLSGGEPFLHPDIIKMAEFLHEEGLNSYTYTSGVSLNEHGERGPISEKMFGQMSNKASKLIFNIEAADENIYNTIMGTRGCFPILQESVRRAVASGIPVEGHFVPNKLNWNQIEETLELCQNLGISRMSFLRLVLHGRALVNRNCLELTDHETEILIGYLQKIQAEGKYPIRIGVPLQGNACEHRCEAAVGKVNIRYDGRVYPCEVFKNDSVRVLDGVLPENIFEKGIEEIYRSSDYFVKTREFAREFLRESHGEKCIGQYYGKRL